MKGNNLHGSAWPHFLHPLDDDALAWGKPRGYEPSVADGSIEREHPLSDLFFAVYDERNGIPLGIPRHSLLWDQDGLIINTLLHHGAEEHAWQEVALWIGNDHPQSDGPCRRFHGDVAELKRSFLGIRCTVFQDEPDLALAFSAVMEAAFLYSTPQPQQLGGGLGHIDVYRIQLLYGGQSRGLLGGHKGAYCDIGFADTTGDRRHHLSVSQVDSDRFFCRLSLLDGCLSNGYGFLVVSYLRLISPECGFRDFGLGHSLVML